MKDFVLRLYMGFGRLKAALMLLVAAVYFALVAYSGGSVPQMLWLWLCAAAFIVLPGLFWGRILRIQKLLPGFAPPLCIALGTGFFAVWYCICMRFSLIWLMRAVPPLLGVVYLVLWARGGGVKRARKALRPKALLPHSHLLVLLVAWLCLVYAFYGVAKNGLPGAVGDVLPSQDLLWNVGNANSFKIAFPPQDIRFVGVRLHYHYLTELVAGALSLVSGVAAYPIVAFYMPPLTLVALVLCLYYFGRLLFPHSLLRAMLVAFTLFLFNCAGLLAVLPNGISPFGNAQLVHLVTNINSGATSVIFLCVFLGLFFYAAQNRYKMGFVYWAVTLCCFVLLCFSKGPLAALVTVALVLTVLAGLPLGHSGVRGLCFAGVVGAVFLYIYFVFFASGANDSVAFSFFKTLETGAFYGAMQSFNTLGVSGVAVAEYGFFLLLYIVQAFLILPAQFPLFARGLVHDVRHFTSLTPQRLFLNALGVGGFLAYFLFYHPANSQVYFLFGGIFALHMLALQNLDTLRRPASAGAGMGKVRTLFTGLVAVCAAVAVATTALLYVHMLGSGARQLLRNLGLEEKYPYAVVLNADDEAAAAWLAENAGLQEMFATNRINTGDMTEEISNVYSALSGRQGYMEGFQYAKTNMGVSEAEIATRMAVNGALFSAETPAEEALALMRENGIQYLVFSTQNGGFGGEAGTQTAGLIRVFASDTVSIWALPEAMGA